MYEKILVDSYPGFLSIRNEEHQIVWMNDNFKAWVAKYTDVDPLGKTNTELTKLVPSNVADTFMQCHDGSLDLQKDSTKEGLKKVIEFVGDEETGDHTLYLDVLKYKVSQEERQYIYDRLRYYEALFGKQTEFNHFHDGCINRNPEQTVPRRKL